MSKFPALLLAIVLTLGSASACPFCNPGESDIFSDVVGAQAVVLVQKLDTRKYKVLSPLFGPVKAGRVVVAAEPQGKLGKSGHWLLTTAGPPNLPYWSDPPRVLNDAELAFAKQSLAKRKASPKEQWDFAARHLESDSAEIATAAYNLLAAAPLLEVQSRATLVGVPRVQNWARNTKIPPERRALYILMVYRHLSPPNVGWLKSELFSPQLSSASPLIGPLAVAYVYLTGVQGVAELEQRFYQKATPASLVNPVNRALTLLYNQSANQSLRHSIRALFHKELEHPQRAAFVLAPLAVWNDFTQSAKVEAIFKRNNSVPWIKVAVIRYFRTFQSAESRAALARLAKLDPQLVERTVDPYNKSDLGVE